MAIPKGLRVQVNPEKTVGVAPIRVRNPISGGFYPSGPFDLSMDDLRIPAVLRMLPRPGQPGGRAGGVFADLVPVDAAPPDAVAVAVPPSPTKSSAKSGDKE